jgi:hypothetical protein
MKSKLLSALSAVVLGTAMLSQSAPAQAGNVSNAQLGCYVDTYAFDYPTDGSCEGYWTPYSASNPTTAVFEVTGLPAGSYTFTWVDLGTGQTGVCSSAYAACLRSIRLNRTVTISVVVTDTQTGANKTLVATAGFWDGWN